ncbi:hypothetical protein TB1_033231 [Malus domestica]
MADAVGLASAKRMCSVPERLQLHGAMLALQFGYAGFHVVLRAALNMGISKLVFPVYRNIIALLLLLPFAYFLEKKDRPAITLNFLILFFLLALIGITTNQGFYLLGLDNTPPTSPSSRQRHTKDLFCIARDSKLDLDDSKHVIRRTAELRRLCPFSSTSIISVDEVCKAVTYIEIAANFYSIGVGPPVLFLYGSREL